MMRKLSFLTPTRIPLFRVYILHAPKLLWSHNTQLVNFRGTWRLGVRQNKTKNSETLVRRGKGQAFSVRHLLVTENSNSYSACKANKNMCFLHFKNVTTDKASTCVLCRKRTIYSKCVLWRVLIPRAQYVSGDVQSIWPPPRPPLFGAPKNRLGRGRVTSSSLCPFKSVYLVRKPFLTTYHSGNSSALGR